MYRPPPPGLGKPAHRQGESERARKASKLSKETNPGSSKMTHYSHEEGEDDRIGVVSFDWPLAVAQGLEADLQMHILTFVGGVKVAQLETISKDMQALVRQPYLWQLILQIEFPGPLPPPSIQRVCAIMQCSEEEKKEAPFSTIYSSEEVDEYMRLRQAFMTSANLRSLGRIAWRRNCMATPTSEDMREMIGPAEMTAGAVFASTDTLPELCVNFAGWGDRTGPCNRVHSMRVGNLLNGEGRWRRCQVSGMARTPNIYGHTFTAIAPNRLLSFGGCQFGGYGGYSDCVLVMERSEDGTLSWVFPEIQGRIEPRGFHAATFLPPHIDFGPISGCLTALDESDTYEHKSDFSEGALLVFGGCTEESVVNDLLLLDIHSWRWFTVTSYGEMPCNRNGCSAVLLGGSVYVSGGGNSRDIPRGGDHFGDVHCLTLSTMTWRCIEPGLHGLTEALARGHHAHAIGDRKIVYFGGHKGNYFFSRVDILDVLTGQWSRPALGGDRKRPRPRGYHSSTVVDGGRKIVIWCGWQGRFGGCLDDVRVLSLDPSTWDREGLEVHTTTSTMGDDQKAEMENVVGDDEEEEEEEEDDEEEEDGRGFGMALEMMTRVDLMRLLGGLAGLEGFRSE